ncbi:MAG: sugar transferase [bacterium]|nr:sugar transferase [bacterium]
MKNSSSLVYAFILLIGDFMALMSAFVLAYILRVNYDDRPLPQQVPPETYFLIFAVLLVFWLIIFALLGLYHGRVYENRFSEAGRILAGCFIGILFLIGAEYVISRPIFPARLVPVYGLGLSFLTVLLFRTIARGFKHTLHSYGVGLNHVLLVGATDITKELAERLSFPESGFKVLGVVGDKRTRYDQVAETHQFANFEEAVSALRHTTLHSIVQTELYVDQIDNDEILTYAQENHIAYRFVPGNARMFVGNIEVDLFQNIPVVAVHQTALIGWGRVVKKLFDLIFGTLFFLVSLPILLVAYVLLKIFDPGPFIFKQERLTRFNTKMQVYKIRSIKTGYNGLLPEEAFEKMGKPELAKEYRANGDFLTKDPRVSAMGRVLRATSIDELPQLWNVMRGDLSLVGPRPLVARDLNKSDRKNIILSVKPGLTGLAVISGRKDLPVDERRKLDQYYVQNWSFWLDLTILAKTIVMVLRGSGAK